MPLIPRLHLIEFSEQPWVPAVIRYSVSRVLTAFWEADFGEPILKFLTAIGVVTPINAVLPPIRRAVAWSGATCVMDSCSGSGGPTPAIERIYNASARAGNSDRLDFYMSDLFPDVSAWQQAAAGRPRLKFLEDSVDATNPPAAVRKMKAFRAFFLSFHHFDDALAKRVVKSAMANGDGFGIFELQSRTIATILSLVMLFPITMLVTLVTPGLRRSLPHLFFTFIIPIVPLIVMVDGMTSALRTRTPQEILAMVEAAREELDQSEGDWKIEVGQQAILGPVKANWLTVAKTRK
ncbi:hypothetical protein HDU87_005868 [Geranomyces variabilis]|uniref:Uncharacterized protein n=1 Tax=Geranomyces variabilis TaxID=109894 RepID=A0AAD5TUV2_9FUNG|nr:hypothetical protein HDU87_005868 [Geranomyces variabilis]